MLQVFNNLFKTLHAENIIFCNWKDHHAIDRHLNGDGDLDLFVPIGFKAKFEEIAQLEGYRRVICYQANHDYIEHYFGLDHATSQFVHIHVYFKIITGEHASKNYDLPLENYILKNLDTSSYLPTINIAGKHAIFLIRYFLKIGSIYGLFQYWRESEKYLNEWHSYDHAFNFESIVELGISRNELNEMNKAYESPSFFKKLLLSIKLKRKLKGLRRRAYFWHQIFIMQNLILRVFNRFVLRKQKILIPGIVVAICGLDGSGKSSVVSTLEANFSTHFCTKVFHLGRPASNTFTFFFNLFVAIYSFLKRIRAAKQVALLATPSKNVSLIYAMRSVLLAYDRKTQSNKAYSYSRNGYIVICDRYPGLENGKMDSPRIPANESRGLAYQSCYNLEQKLYRSIKQAKFIFQLSVPLEIAIHRNSLRNKFGKETEDELRERFFVNSDAKFLGENYHTIDASTSFSTVLKQVLDGVWYSKNWN